jgi:hypothetical protein
VIGEVVMTLAEVAGVRRDSGAGRGVPEAVVEEGW